MSQENKRIVEEINTSFIEGKPEDFLKYCTEDVVWTMEGEKTTEGLASVREWMTQMDGFEPPKFTVDKMIADGDTVACYGEMSMNAPPEAAGSYSYCDIYTFAGGKVKELRSFVVKHKSADEKSDSAAG